MTVYILIREDQNDHGFVDTSITGVFLRKDHAEEAMAEEAGEAREQHLRVEGDDDPEDDDWDVCWFIEKHALS